MAPGIAISARSYPYRQDAANLLFFHGNGEVACQYDGLAPFYHDCGANLFVADYRGYGLSDGEPSIDAMMLDARRIYEYYRGYLAQNGLTGPRFVKGRSLGSQSAIEIAATFGSDLSGVIIESGFAGPERLFTRLGVRVLPRPIKHVIHLHRKKVRSIRLPLLVIHGQEDQIVPVELATDLYRAVAAESKDILLIPGAGHNNVIATAQEAYFDSVKQFLLKHGGVLG